MRVKLLIARAAATGSQNAGEEIEVSSDEASRMFDAGQAVPVRGQKAERAVKKSAPEKAVKK